MNKNEADKISVFWQYKVQKKKTPYHPQRLILFLEQMWNFKWQITSNKFTSTALIC